MTPREHDLKLETAYFDALLSGDKNFEVRRDDRGFQRGDILVLCRWGRTASGAIGYLDHRGWAATRLDAQSIRRRITYILTGGQFGIEPGYVVLGLEAIE